MPKPVHGPGTLAPQRAANGSLPLYEADSWRSFVDRAGPGAKLTCWGHP
jgi:hypothetical protein